MTSAAHFSAGGGRLSQLLVRASLGGDPDKNRRLPSATAAYAIRLMPPRTTPEGERVRTVTTAAVLLHSRALSSMPMRFGRTTHQSVSSCRGACGIRATTVAVPGDLPRASPRESAIPHSLAGRDSGALCSASTLYLLAAARRSSLRLREEKRVH